MRGKAVAAATIPTLPRAPLLGNLNELRKDRLGLLERVVRECGDVGSFHLGRRPIYVFNAPEYVGEVLIENWEAFEKGPMVRKFAKPFLGSGLISCDNSVHRRRRALVAPAFQPQRIERYVRLMTETVEEACASWKDGARLDLHAEMMQITLRVIGRTIFSADLGGEGREIAEALDVGLRYITDRLKYPLHLPLLFPTPSNLRVKRAIARLDSTISALVKERRASGKDQGDVLSKLVFHRESSGDRLTDREIRDELVTFFLAGFETVTNGLTWTWSFLAQNPKCADRMHEEVDSVLGSRPPAWDDLSRLGYTLQVFKEALRIYPPVHTLGRQTSRPVAIGPYRLHAGAIALVCPYLMHRRADLFPDPLRFDPNRFAPKAEEALPRHAYIPFGAGPRVCIGAFFALTEAQVILSAIARRFSFQLVGPPPEPEPLLTLRPKGGVPVIVRVRS